MQCPNVDCPDSQVNGFLAEYKSDVILCPFCGTNLVPSEETRRQSEDSQLLRNEDEGFEDVFETLNSFEATIIKSLLESEEIPHLIRNEDQFDQFRGVFRSGMFYFNGRPIVFSVPSSVAKQTKELLNERDLSDESSKDWS